MRGKRRMVQLAEYERMLTRREAGLMAGVSTDTIDRWIERGLIPVMRDGRQIVRIPEDGLRGFLLSRTVPARRKLNGR